MKFRKFIIGCAAVTILSCTSTVNAGTWSADNFAVTTADKSGSYYGIIVGSGGIGILPSREIGKMERVVLNHVFDAAGYHGMNIAVEGINPFNMKYEIDGRTVALDDVEDWSQTVDLRHGVHVQEFTVPGKAIFTVDIRALRGMPYCGLESVRVKALSDCRLTVTGLTTLPGKTYVEPRYAINDFYVVGNRIPVSRVSALTANSLKKVSASAAFLNIPDGGERLRGDHAEHGFTIELKKGSVISFDLLGSICSTADFTDPENESDRQITYGACDGTDRIINAHNAAWNDLWKGDVIIEGDDEAQQVIRMSLYNLYSSARKGSRLSIPPFGLSSVGYSGHIFWDTELWMYPPMLFLNDGIAQSMMDYRIDRFEAARKRAQAYGFDGAMYPWESDCYGEEACPTWALTGAFEHHITADIAIAIWNYYCMTRDQRWLKERGYPILEAIADFWTSRVDANDDGSYSIRKVVCADEYAEGVDDNSFTNAAVSTALNNTVAAANALGITPRPVWTQIARNLRIPMLEDGVTAEYDGYDGRTIKQADANLLGYPLGFVKDEKRLKKDLEYYENRIDATGPAMSLAVFAVQYSRMGMGDKAYELFKRSFTNNQLPPFGAVSEGAGGTNPFFCTGAGGFLQAVINGFCGLEITNKGVVQKSSSLPSHWKSVTVTGVGPERRTYTRK